MSYGKSTAALCLEQILSAPEHKTAKREAGKQISRFKTFCKELIWWCAMHERKQILFLYYRDIRLEIDHKVCYTDEMRRFIKNVIAATYRDTLRSL